MIVNCPRCKAPQEMDQSMLGRKWRCGQCGQKIKVNAPPEGAGTPAAAAPVPPAPAPKPAPAPPIKAASQRRESAVPAPAARAASQRREIPVPTKRSSVRRRAVPDADLEDGADALPPKATVSNDQAKYMIGGFVAVFLIFGIFVFMKNGSRQEPSHRSTSRPGVVLSPLEQKRAALAKDPSNLLLHKELACMLMDRAQTRGDYMEAAEHLDFYLREMNDMDMFTRAVECAFTLDDRDAALALAERAKAFDPARMEPILRLVARDDYSRGLAEERAMSVAGMPEALKELEEGIACFKLGQDDNAQFKTASDHLRKALEVFEKAQTEFPYNLWLERRMETANKNLMWANKMYRNLSEHDKEMWVEEPASEPAAF